MAPLRQILPFVVLVGFSLIQLSNQYCDDTSPAGHVDDGRQASQSGGGESIRYMTGDIAATGVLLQCNLTGLISDACFLSEGRRGCRVAAIEALTKSSREVRLRL
jgi:hypothetical protein